MADVLLTVSGEIDNNIDAQIAAGQCPRADYLEMARAFDADLLDYARAREAVGRLGRLLERLGGANLMLAWACFLLRSRYQTIFTDGEQVGIPLALLLKLGGRRGVRHLMIVHILSVGKKMLFFDWLRVQSHIDLFFVYATWQKRFIEARWGVPDERVVFTPFMVDDQFFAPTQVTPSGSTRPMICSVGLEFRDYPTLMQAVDGLDVDVIIAAASPWSKRSDSTAGERVPENVTVRRFSQHELRQIYADSCFVVMPLFDVNFQAGVTAILEAMAMAKAVVCSRTPGQTDVVLDGETGLYVPPGDADALRDAIEQLLAEPERAASLGRAGRRRVEREMSLRCYTQRLSYFI